MTQSRRPSCSPSSHMSACTVVLVALVTLALAACQGPEVAQRVQPITDGTDDTGHPEVGLLLIGASGGQAKSICTGTVVGSKTVLTATHCLEVGEATLFQHGGALYTVTKMIRRSDWNPSSSKFRKDIGLAVLDKVVPNVTPALLSTVAPKVGAPVTLVGFGTTGDNVKDAGKKRTAENTIATIPSDYFTINGSGSGKGNVCQGDSGGPVFGAGGKIVGVISASNAPCGSKSFHVRVDAFASWLVQQAAGDIGGGADSEKPTVSITSPENGASVAESFRVEVDATDDVGVVAVELEVDGKPSKSLTAAPYGFDLTLAPGTHALTATAKDAAGNSASASVSVNVGGVSSDGGASLPDSAVDAASSGAFGSACVEQKDCEGALLCREVESQRFCTASCILNTASCPEGSECVDVGGQPLCTKPAQERTPIEDGCSVGASGDSGRGLMLMLVLLALVCCRRWRR